MADHGAQRHPPVILARGHGNGGDLAPVAPLTQECHDECLYPGRAQQQGEQVGHALDGVLDGTRAGGRAHGRLGRRPRRRGELATGPGAACAEAHLQCMQIR